MSTNTEQTLLLTLLQRVKGMLGLSNAGSSVRVRRDDRFIVSYPRSGNTWMRFLLGNAIRAGQQLPAADFRCLEALVPDIYENSNVRLARMQGPRMLKSHEPFTTAYPVVLYVVRDPRDVAVSYRRYFERRWPGKLDDESFIDCFIHGGLDPYGTWLEHATSWIRKPHPGRLTVRYEDILRRPAEQLAAICDHFRLAVSRSDIEEAVGRSSMQTLRGMENDPTQAQAPILRAADPGNSFIGGHGNTSDTFRAEVSGRLTQAWGTHLSELGY